MRKTKRNRKISAGLMLFLFLVLLIVLALPKSDSDNEYEIKKVEIKGNNYLNASAYIDFARINNEAELSQINLSNLKDRLEKHPYVKYADILPADSGIVIVTLHEKKFQAVVLLNNEQYLVDESLRMCPLLPFTMNIDLPVVENVKGLTLKNSSANKELKKALKIIYAAKVLDESLFDSISEVDMNFGKGIEIRFANDDYSLKLGRGKEIRKIAYFEVLFRNLNKARSKGILDYVDLRFKDEICLGFRNDI